jgi:hypothetical protein
MQFLRPIQQHWTIENRLHWVRDVTFDEDHPRPGGTAPVIFEQPAINQATGQFIFGLPLGIFHELTIAVSAFMILVASSGRPIFDHVI